MWGCKGASVLDNRGSGPKLRTQDPSLPASQPTKGPRWLGTTSGQEGRQGLEVSAAVMAMARLRPFFRITTIEEVYSRAHARTHMCAHRHTQRHTSSIQVSPSEAEKT